MTHWESGLQQLVKEMEEAGGFWCKDPALKYLNIRVDTRSCDFLITSEAVEDRISQDRIRSAIAKWTEQRNEQHR